MLGLITGFLRGSKFGRHVSRGTLTPKRLPRGWTKGYGVRKMGEFGNNRNFLLQEDKQINFITPNLTDCELKAYVSLDTPKIKVPPPVMPK